MLVMVGITQSGRVLDCGSNSCEFKSHYSSTKLL
jgi:hypothetical protein